MTIWEYFVLFIHINRCCEYLSHSLIETIITSIHRMSVNNVLNIITEVSSRGNSERYPQLL